jgi:hypothetical protein
LTPTGYQELGFTNAHAFEINPDGTKFLVSFYGGVSSIAVYDWDMNTGNIHPKGNFTSLQIDTRPDKKIDALKAEINHTI